MWRDKCSRFDWLMLTKRPQNIIKMLQADWGDGYRNMWLGMTAENQHIPAIIKFISYEPTPRPLRLPKRGPFPDWLISGGESGGGARQLDPAVGSRHHRGLPEQGCCAIPQAVGNLLK